MYEQQVERVLKAYNNESMNNPLVVQFIHGNRIGDLLDTVSMNDKEDALVVANILSFKHVETPIFESLLCDIIKHSDLFTFICCCKKNSSLTFDAMKLFKLAVKCKHMDIVRYMLMLRHSDIEIDCYFLLKLCKFDNEIFKLVLKYGNFGYVTIDYDDRGGDHECTFQMPFFKRAIDYGDSEMLELLMTDPRFDSYTDCGCYSHEDIIKKIIKRGDSVMINMVLDNDNFRPTERSLVKKLENKRRKLK